MHVSNVGNALAKPTGSVTIENKSGLSLQKVPFRMDTFLPHTSIDYPIALSKGLPPGSYTVAVSMSYQQGGTSGAVQTITAAPSLSVSKAAVAQIFKSSTPTKAGSGITSALNSSSSKTSILVYVLIGLVALLVIAVVVALLMLRSRRRDTRPQRPRRDAPRAAAPTHTPPPAAPRTEAPPVATAVPSGSGAADPCVPFHYWEVAWHQGRPGQDGVTRFPHRCRNCGIQVLATDINDAAKQAAELGR